MNRQDDEPCLQSRSSKWMRVLLLVCLALVGAMIIWSQWFGARQTLPLSPSHPLVGTWTRPNPQGTGTTHFNTFTADGTFIGRDYSDASGAILQDVRASWRFENGTLILKASWNAPEERFQIAAITNDELHIAGIVYKKASGDTGDTSP